MHEQDVDAAGKQHLGLKAPLVFCRLSMTSSRQMRPRRSMTIDDATSKMLPCV